MGLFCWAFESICNCLDLSQTHLLSLYLVLSSVWDGKVSEERWGSSGKSAWGGEGGGGEEDSPPELMHGRGGGVHV